MTELTTDTAAMKTEAVRFDSIGGQLRDAIAGVEKIAGSLSDQWKGQAADAAQAALQRYRDAAAQQVQVLNDLSTNVQIAVDAYEQTDTAAAGRLTSAMGGALGGPPG